MNNRSELSRRITFGRFCLLPHRRELLKMDQPIRLASRAFDVLIALIEARGDVVSKDALMARVWPDQVVEENNIEVQISTLRTILGEDRDLIRTVPRYGYQFTGELQFAAQDAVPTNLPQVVSELIGRDDDLLEVLRLAGANRLLTLTGTGGIGKTRLALAAACQLTPQFSDGVWLIELAPVSKAELVPAVVATAAGLEFAAGAITAEGVANALKGKEVLLVLDNCEHVIDAAAMIAEAVLRANGKARVLATSREAFRTEGEQVHTVPPLALPEADGQEGTDFLDYGAIRLFVERARAAGSRFAPDKRSVAMIAVICRHLDGIPLAIELAAARAAAFGIEALAARINECFDLLTGGKRTALPRHQTLRATLDWSFELLSDRERLLLRRLGAFVGHFGLEAVSAVAATLEPAVSDMTETLSSLVAKSLVVADVENVATRYRLLDTTRTYALEKLIESGEDARVARRHAAYYRDLFERAQREWRMRPTADWVQEYSWRIDNLRVALDWAFSAAGDVSIGIALTAAAVPLWMLLSLVGECRHRVQQALGALEAETTPFPSLEMRLHAAMGEALTYDRGATLQYEAAWTNALAMAEKLDDVEYQLRSLWGLWSYHLTRGGHRIALALAQRFCTIAKDSPDPYDRLFGERMIGAALHHLGDQTGARDHLEEGLTGRAGRDHKPTIIRFQADLHVTARAFLARVLWFQGFPDKAARTAQRAVAEAQDTGHPLSFCLAVAMAACPVALLTGDLVAAGHYAERLQEHASKHGLPLWLAYSRCYQGTLIIKRGQVEAGTALLRAGFAELGEAQSAVLRLVRVLAAEHFGLSERITAIQEAIDHSERTEERWLIAELLRLQGEFVLSQGAKDAAAAAADHFRRALDWARRQGALAWELRAATSFAQLLCDQGLSCEALACLEPVYDRFSEGFNTADLKSARALLYRLRQR